MRHINTNSDSELLLNIFAEELQRKRVREMSADEIFDTVRGVMRRCKGAYAVVMLIEGVGILGFRDPYGIRPLCFGIQIDDDGQPNGYAIGNLIKIVNQYTNDLFHFICIDFLSQLLKALPLMLSAQTSNSNATSARVKRSLSI